MARKTKAQSVLAVASDLAGRDLSREYGTTMTEAIDALADALAGTDVRKGETVSDAVLLVDRVVGGVVDDVAALRSALEESGADVGDGSVPAVLGALRARVESGGMAGGVVYATDDEVRAALSRGA